MYTYEQRMKAVAMYVSGKYSLAAIIEELGYPSCRQSILNWCEEFHQEGNLHQNYEREAKYSMEEKITPVAERFLKQVKFSFTGNA